MKRVIIANARFWLDTLNAASADTPIPESDIRGAVKALEAVMAVPEAWSLTLALTLALHPHVERRGYGADWGDFLHALAAHARQREDAAAEVELALIRGAVQRQRGDHPGAMASYRRAWWLCRQAGDRLGWARALSNLGDLCRLRRHFRRAEVLCREALTLFETLQDTMRMADTENHLGLIYYDQGRWSEALPHLTRSQTLSEQIGDQYGLAQAARNLGVLHRRTGDLDAALDCFRQAIQHFQALGDEISVAGTRLNVGNVYLNQSDLLRAERAYSRAEAILKRMGDSLDLARTRHNLGLVYTRLQDWMEAAACFEQALEQWRNRGDTWNLVNTLGDFAGLHLARGDFAQARSCLDEAWGLVSERREAHYDSLRSRLAERRQELRRLTGE